MSGETVTLHGVIRNGAALIDEDVKLPDGTPVKVVVAVTDLPPALRSQLAEARSQTDGPVVDQWEREE